MFESLNRFFSQKLARSADAAEDAHRLRVATCALLLEAAHADEEFSAEERRTLQARVGRRFGLDEAETADLLAVADRQRQQGQGLYEFARLLNEHFPHERKLAVVELLWETVFSDGILDSHEDALLHKVGTLLGVRLDELMALKRKARRDAAE